jgi:hypothetical protein
MMMANEMLANFIKDNTQILEWEGELSRKRQNKLARSIVIRELRADQAQETADEWKLRVEIARAKFKYDHEALLTILHAAIADISSAAQRAALEKKEQPAKLNS